ncbi:hypothetical protein EDC56_3474 [Sinobacterium caligoides]|uniref:Lipoprotein n=1 Tax=Sinobacterium caligoides TaxID=933926 RepID=A0A3N2DGE7_9GAMM|nr:hypothetical protein [Sinobacterium caligoides]ROR98738.1 hypothetical protein EDC56_3474 [Sinobacterium caligoides]
MQPLTKIATVLLCSASLFTVAGCSLYKSNTYVPSSSCEGLNDIIAHYPSGYAELRGTAKPLRKLTLYDTPYQIVKGSCHIWAWDDGKSTYTCSKNFSSESAAGQLFKEMQSTVEQCLDDSWSKTITPRKQPENDSKITYQRGNQLPAVTLQRIKIDKVGKPQWALYLFVGDLEQRL